MCPVTQCDVDKLSLDDGLLDVSRDDDVPLDALNGVLEALFGLVVES